MVNYCCVNGCGRNSRQNNHLKFYSIPKERERQVLWLVAAGREDLLGKGQEKLTVSHRFCSRHFVPSSVKNKNLHYNASPTLNLPGSSCSVSTEVEPVIHNVICNNCNNSIHGFRYKCVTCKNYDLCQKCEMQETHTEHFMLRISKPLKYKQVAELLSKITLADDSDLESIDSDSSDDKPINEYVRNYDSGIDLPDDVKSKIRHEVNRAVSLCAALEETDETNSNNKSTPNRKRAAVRKTGSNIGKKKKTEECNKKESPCSTFPEVVFADVNGLKDVHLLSVKTETPSAGDSIFEGPFAHVKLNEDLTELTIDIMKDHS